jgi:hypothetical protein
MTRTRLLTEYGLDFNACGEYAVPDFCLRMRAHAIRTVYNPWAVARCNQPPKPSAAIIGDHETFKKKYAHILGQDPYYH